MFVVPCDPARLLATLQELAGEFEQWVTQPLLSHRERLLLFTLAACLNPGRYLEIGAWKGGSATIVSRALDAMDNQTGKMFLIDPHFQVSPDTWGKIRHRTTLVPGYSPDMIPKAFELSGRKFDMALVDGAHDTRSATADLLGISSYLMPGAYVLVHDYSIFEVKAAVDYVRDAGLYVDCGLLVDDPWDTGQLCQEGTHKGEKRLDGGMYLLRWPGNSRQSSKSGPSSAFHLLAHLIGKYPLIFRKIWAKMQRMFI